MRLRLSLLLATSAIACSRDGSTTIPVENHLTPPEPSVTAASLVVSGAGAPSLVISASIANRTSVHFRVNIGPQCPVVQIVADSTNESFVSAGCPTGTTVGAPTIDLAPGDSVVLQRVVVASDLASFPPGLYRVYVAVTTDRLSIAVPTGTLRLPLMAGP